MLVHIWAPPPHLLQYTEYNILNLHNVHYLKCFINVLEQKYMEYIILFTRLLPKLGDPPVGFCNLTNLIKSNQIKSNFI